MEQRVPTYTSSPYQYIENYSEPYEAQTRNTNEPITGSFNERPSFHNFDHDTLVHRPMGTPMEFMDILALEVSCGSPHSTSSTISHSESVSSPPYTGFSAYNTLEPAFHNVQHSSTNHAAVSNEPESLWPSTYPEVTSWNSRPYVLPYHEIPSYEQRSYQLMPTILPEPRVSAPVPYLPYPMPQQDSPTPAVDSGAFDLSGFNNIGDESDDLSDSDSDDSWHDEPSSSRRPRRWSSRRAQPRSNVYRLEGWSANTCTFHTTTDRRHQCLELIGPNKDTPCPKKFQRPEHLRRHIRSVHGIGLVNVYKCKVPDCFARFRRSDNFRSHYLTHLRVGKRKGNNRKMTYQELKGILGPKEKDLVRWIKNKLTQT
ncbi:hypothetical protein COCMIDRAFT_4292 [Bipolaris oryzae ATCC 44560]|uniref:C2H2-type domain-containing protein n=1 Tax=Bipolaris oryzae ATCC 44560 TaxID=930090 RepID=W6Z4G5_COCMI|nr:uncharacterized protein COCMIDRAFT_4292 [Bipolaris oryzae ATCC 44560]EUC46632.1 hypothetical protein COCMIDRAFT_4292 [Bipolaris oryzae ATCC 44560]